MRTKSNHLNSNDCFNKNIKETKVDKIFIDKRYFLQAFIPVTKFYLMTFCQRSKVMQISSNESYLMVFNIGLNSEL